MWYVREREELRKIVRVWVIVVEWMMGLFYWIDEIRDLREVIEFYFEYIIFELFVKYLSKFYVGFWVYEFKFKEGVKFED